MFFGLLYGFSLSKQKKMRFQEVRIDISDRNEMSFVTQSTMEKLLTHNGNYVNGQIIDSVDVESIERRVNNNPYVKHAEAYVDLQGVFHLEVSQRNPIVRVIGDEGRSFYIDEDGVSMPTSDIYTEKVIPCTGVMGISPKYYHNRESVKGDDVLLDVWKLSVAIHSDEFFKKQFVQLDINKDGEAILIPRVGNHEIIFGKINDIDKKLIKLTAFYENGIKQSNWNIYKSIDLNYKGQVVCKKR